MLFRSDIINCSWGSSSKSEAEHEILNAAISFGSAIVAAAGNDNMNTSYYPAGYKGVMSVAAVDTSDTKAYFSNYNRTVDVSSPGTEILSTVPDSTYSYMDGTSMATPIAAGVASMVKLMFPNYNYLQIIEHIKATAISIDAKNPQYSGNLGTGRVDAYAAVSNEDVRSVTLNNYSYTDTNNDGVLDIGETIEISCEFLNVLKPVKNARVKARSMSLFKPQFIVSEVELGDLQTNDLKIPKDKFSFVVPENIPIDYTMDIEFFVTDDNGFCGRELVPFVFRPSYRTMDANNISVTFNSIGNIGFNDYSNNEQGKGFIYGNSQNLLFEGALMIGVSPYKISNVARGSNQSYKDLSFSTDNIFILKNPGNEAELEGMANFNDLSFLDGIGVDIKQTVYQFNEDGKKDFIICVYDIHNKSDNDFDSLFVGLFFDWDIGPSGANNQANFDDEYYFGYVQNVQIDTIPLAGVKMLDRKSVV